MEQFFSSPTEFRKVENDPEKFFRFFEEKKNRSFLIKKICLKYLKTKHTFTLTSRMKQIIVSKVYKYKSMLLSKRAAIEFIQTQEKGHKDKLKTSGENEHNINQEIVDETPQEEKGEEEKTETSGENEHNINQELGDETPPISDEENACREYLELSLIHI